MTEAERLIRNDPAIREIAKLVKDADMTAPFDWAGLAHGTYTEWSLGGHFPEEAAAYLRTRIEAAFVPVERYNERTETFRLQLKIAAEATARAEAAEAENARLRLHVEILEEALIDHNCGSPACICVGCIEKRDAALGGEHE